MGPARNAPFGSTSEAFVLSSEEFLIVNSKALWFSYGKGDSGKPGRVGRRRGGVQEGPSCFRPFRLVPHSPLHHSVSGARHIEPDGRVSRIRLTAKASSIGVMCLFNWGVLSRSSMRGGSP